MSLFPDYRVLAVFIFSGVMLLGSGSVGAFSLLEWLGFGGEDTAKSTQPQPASPQTQANWAESAPAVAANAAAKKPAADGGGQIRFNDIKLIVANLNPQQRQKLLSDETAFREFIERQVANESVLVAAKANNLEREPFTRLLMQKSADNTLREIYIKRLINKELPEDFPTEEQARAFYDNNTDRFVLEERMQVWQIFLPFGPDADEATRKQVREQAVELKKAIESKKTTFAEAASQQSRHIPSRHAGGYMGLIKLSEIKPEIEKTVLELKEGRLSGPVKTAEGYHLLMRGSRIAPTQLSFEQVKPRINQALREEAEKRLRQAIFSKARETYNVDMDNKRVEEWRLRLRTNL